MSKMICISQEEFETLAGAVSGSIDTFMYLKDTEGTDDEGMIEILRKALRVIEDIDNRIDTRE